MKIRVCLWVIGVVAGAVMAVACKKVVTVDLDEAPSQIVIEGNVTNDSGPYEVMISRTVNFSAGVPFPPVSGAIVSITDSNAGLTDQLQEVAPGVYSTINLEGIPRHTYNLAIFSDGNRYTASSTMPLPVTLDSVSLEENISINNQKGINAVVNFQDPPGIVNYYQFTEIVNGKLLPDVFVFDDRLSDGRYIRDPLFNDSNYLRPGDTLTLTMNGVDRPIYNYFLTLGSMTGNGNFQSTATPANPATNLSNGALGYFSAHTTAGRLLVVY
jgi:hypothetical protein